MLAADHIVYDSWVYPNLNMGLLESLWSFVAPCTSVISDVSSSPYSVFNIVQIFQFCSLINVSQAPIG